MSLYLELIKKTIDSKPGFRPFDPLYCYYNRLLIPGNLISPNTKISELHCTLYKPFFITAQQREELLDTVCLIQRRYWALSRLARIFKYKYCMVKYPVAISSDLYMTDISPVMKNVVTIQQNGQQYYFTIRDLINIINKNLSNSDSFFPKPLPIKNPYNNIRFTSSQLYNIYFAIRESSYVMPELLQGYFKCGFDIEQFCITYESIMRIISIRSYVYNSHYDVLYPYAIILCYYHNLWIYDNIHDDFPKDVLVKIFRPFIYLYLMGNYGIQDTLVVDDANVKLKSKLRAFSDYNPNFGRIFITHKVVNGKRKKEISFNTKHANFSDL